MQTDVTRLFFLFHLMLHDPEPFDRDLDHLSAFGEDRRTGFEVPVTGGTTPDPMGYDLIWSLDLTQGVPLVPWLASGLFAALFAQRFGHTDKAIRGGRQAGRLLLWLSLDTWPSRGVIRSW